MEIDYSTGNWISFKYDANIKRNIDYFMMPLCAYVLNASCTLTKLLTQMKILLIRNYAEFIRKRIENDKFGLN